ncbi:B12-binding domain-containing radical SAM protein [Streptomyces sviceus]|uniref:B12-binding domain-containing radical SAM protein n=1 Tax=Streptomyces sviceus TaxID=285530 RepID=UPI00367C30D7
MRLVYFQPRLNAERNYRNGAGTEQVWTPWWALLLHQYVPSDVHAELIDARTDASWEKALEAALGPDVLLAVSVMTGHAIRDSIHASKVGRAAGARVVWGGPHATLFAEDLEREPYIDHVITGFGARSFGRLVESLRAGAPVPRTTDSRGAAGPMLVTLSRGPTHAENFAPDLTLVSDWSRYLNADQAIGHRAVNLITSEGCLRRCTYCSEPATSGHSWLAYDVEQCADVASEVIERADADSLKLHDPNFLQDLPRGVRFGQLLQERVGKPWAATLHPSDLLDIADDDLARLSASGLRRVLVGLESPVQELVNLAGKRYDVTRIPEIATKLARHDIAGMFTFIVGWPGATEPHYQQTIDSAFGIKDVSAEHQAKIHFLEPWPGTPIFKLISRTLPQPIRTTEDWANIDYYFAHLPKLHSTEWEVAIRQANEELSPYVEA